MPGTCAAPTTATTVCLPRAGLAHLARQVLVALVDQRALDLGHGAAELGEHLGERLGLLEILDRLRGDRLARRRRPRRRRTATRAASIRFHSPRLRHVRLSVMLMSRSISSTGMLCSLARRRPRRAARRPA